MTKGQTKECPLCGGEILAKAIKCKHCKSDLKGVTSDSRQSLESPEKREADPVHQLRVLTAASTMKDGEVKTSVPAQQSEAHGESAAGVPDELTVQKGGGQKKDHDKKATAAGAIGGAALGAAAGYAVGKAGDGERAGRCAV